MVGTHGRLRTPLSGGAATERYDAPVNHALETERLSLRPFTIDDADGWHAIWGDPEVIWWGANESFEISRTRLEGLLANEPTWPDGVGWLAVRTHDTDEIVGDLLFQAGPFPGEGTEIGWHFRKHAQNNGYATEAARAVIERAFADALCDRVYALVETSNKSSERVAEKLGMTSERDIEYAGLPHRLFVIKRGA